MNISEEIKRLHELHQAGALTDAEFEQAKQKLLNASLNFNKSSDSGSGNNGNNGNNNGPHHQGSNFSTDLNQLRRSRADRWVGGVCGGLGKITGMESWIWRLIFALFTISFGFGLLIYVLMWIFVPEE
jgi:phage shock protein C